MKSSILKLLYGLVLLATVAGCAATGEVTPDWMENTGNYAQ